LVAVGRLHKQCDDRGIDIFAAPDVVTA
jgi:hypothetical protein